ncbi:methyltransferase domain-containing protein [Ancylothrix sp. C2]|uniref:CheR family methyltransferase n=1 Tax=Ancylothrix sp. D3o TaxID=2953691 RepID=UPI0021BA885C|nr:CheR family methyltransferase [Ancylothrix sp. D3o]MCT7950048.1 methyltransferase domain-containing protein [Ancylothrix sp. D3o]
MQETLNLIESLLQQKTGLEPKIIGPRKIGKAVENRLALCDGLDINTYLKLLRTSAQEFAELVELLIVPETWFFRERQAFDFISHYLRSQWLPQSNQTPLRLLSVPCSSGEEPYSLAMQLLDMGLVPAQFQIDAIDISQQSLEKAKKGIYTRNSFRGNNLEFQSRYFTEINQEYHLKPNIRGLVNFTQKNILGQGFWKNPNSYDIIFCRNLLIYFDTAARTQAIKTLQSLLKNKGLLFVAASETSLIAELGFELIRSPFGLAGQKKGGLETLKLAPPAQITLNNNPLDLKDKKQIHPEKTQPNNRPVQTIPPQPPRHSEQSFGKVEKEYNSLTSPNPEQKEKNQQKLNLKTIRDLADQGFLNEAAAQCQNYLNQHSTSAEAYVLLGQIYHAQNLEIQAEQHFQKALYLNPKNSEAILHLALLKEQRGEISKATLLRQRLQRIQTL